MARADVMSDPTTCFVLTILTQIKSSTEDIKHNCLFSEGEPPVVLEAFSPCHKQLQQLLHQRARSKKEEVQRVHVPKWLNDGCYVLSHFKAGC